MKQIRITFLFSNDNQRTNLRPICIKETDVRNPPNTTFKAKERVLKYVSFFQRKLKEESVFSKTKKQKSYNVIIFGKFCNLTEKCIKITAENTKKNFDKKISTILFFSGWQVAWRNTQKEKYEKLNVWDFPKTLNNLIKTWEINK